METDGKDYDNHANPSGNKPGNPIRGEADRFKNFSVSSFDAWVE
jgi:hypothetical protein